MRVGGRLEEVGNPSGRFSEIIPSFKDGNFLTIFFSFVFGLLIDNLDKNPNLSIKHGRYFQKGKKEKKRIIKRALIAPVDSGQEFSLDIWC